MKSTVVFLVDCLERQAFFCRLAPAFRQLGYNTVMLTHRYSAYLKCRGKGESVVLARYQTQKKYDYKLEETLEGAAAFLSPSAGKCLADSIAGTMDVLANKHQIKLLLIWNGNRCSGHAMGVWARANNVQTLYLEIGNFPGKLFADKLGVNANSSIANNPALLGNGNLDVAAYHDWKADYLSRKMQTHHVPQSASAKHVNLCYALDLFAYYFIGLKRDNAAPLWPQIKNKLMAQKLEIVFDDVDSNDEPYCFFPMQVSTDSQLLLFSDYDNIAAICKAHELAKQDGLKLYVKPHPAELNIELLNQLYKLKQEIDFSLVDGNTFKYLQDANRVVTINSTVGLEAMLMEKTVTVLGRAVYSEFQHEDVMNYIQNYLLDIDYFAEAPLTPNDAEMLLERLEHF